MTKPRDDNETVVNLRPAQNLTWHGESVTQAMREKANGHRGATLWFTGLSGSGKSTMANVVAEALFKRGLHVYVLDGDNIRHGLNRGLGFSNEDRRENIRRIAEVARLFTDAGILNIAAFISPFRSDRDAARALQPDANRFIEVYIQADVETCASRDPKGLYKKAIAGEITGFTGVSADAPYEEPLNPEITVPTGKLSIKQGVELILQELEIRGVIPKLG